MTWTSYKKTTIVTTNKATTRKTVAKGEEDALEDFGREVRHDKHGNGIVIEVSGEKSYVFWDSGELTWTPTNELSSV